MKCFFRPRSLYYKSHLKNKECVADKHIRCSRDFFWNFFRDFFWNTSIGSCKNFSRDAFWNLSRDSHRNYTRFFLEVFLGIAPRMPPGIFSAISQNTSSSSWRYLKKGFVKETLEEFLYFLMKSPDELTGYAL